MDDSAGENQSQSSDEEFVPNSQESSCEEDETPRKRAKKKCACDDESCQCRAKIVTKTHHKSTKKQAKYLTSKQKKKEHDRNRSYASKLACLDLHEVQNFLAGTRCQCKNQCLKQLCELQDSGSIEAVYQLRNQRFACTSRPYPYLCIFNSYAQPAIIALGKN